MTELDNLEDGYYHEMDNESMLSYNQLLILKVLSLILIIEILFYSFS